MIQDNNLWKMDYKFEKDDIYEFQIIFNNRFTNNEVFFEECNNIISLDLSNFNTENVTDMSWMFSNCNRIKKIIGINKFNTNKVNNMFGMFSECYKLEYLDLSNFNTENVTDMSNMLINVIN